jgi:predicted DNA-binding transcriptional regulator AlpA
MRVFSANPLDRPTSRNTLEGMTMILFNTRELADLLGVSSSKLEKLRVSGGGPKFIKLGSNVRYLMPDIIEWVSNKSHHSTSDRRTA